MSSDRDALTELLATVESIIAEKEARLLVVTSDGARTNLIDDIAKLQISRKDILTALFGDVHSRRAQ